MDGCLLLDGSPSIKFVWVLCCFPEKQFTCPVVYGRGAKTGSLSRRAVKNSLVPIILHKVFCCINTSWDLADGRTTYVVLRTCKEGNFNIMCFKKITAKVIETSVMWKIIFALAMHLQCKNKKNVLKQNVMLF